MGAERAVASLQRHRGNLRRGMTDRQSGRLRLGGVTVIAGCGWGERADIEERDDGRRRGGPFQVQTAMHPSPLPPPPRSLRAHVSIRCHKKEAELELLFRVGSHG